MRRTILIVSLLVLCRLETRAGEPAVAAATAGRSVRFLSSSDVCQMRVQILSAAGEMVAESDWSDGNLAEWNASALPTGSYRCIVGFREFDGAISSTNATLVVTDTSVSVAEIAAPAAPKITVVAHDGEKASIISSSGDLSFRFGDVLAGTDAERMRLTSDGDLDVTGVIRAKKGIELPDGTIVASAAAWTDPTVSPRGVRAPAVVHPPLAATSSTAAKIPRANTTPDFQFKVDATGMHVGTTSAFGLDVSGNVTLASNLVLPATTTNAGQIIVDGLRFFSAFGPANIFLGNLSGNPSVTGARDIGIGGSVLSGVTSGSDNIGIGSMDLFANTTGSGNTAVGSGALNFNDTGNRNVAVGDLALSLNTTGGQNTAVGSFALQNATGNGNIAVGFSAGNALTSGNNNIVIGNNVFGVAGEANTTRIGGAAQSKTFIAGISGVTPAGASPVAVVVDSNGQLGVVTSSRRYKFDIHDAGDSTDGLMRLRPVTFRYKVNGPEGPLQFGLIAEEVADVYPEMVARNSSGEPETVMYQFLAPMLLNEVQKQHARIEDQLRTIDDLRATVAALAQRLEAVERRDVSR